MEEHPIEGLMLTAMDSIRDMIDVNTIIGEPMQIQEDVGVIPISKVSFGFAAGGSEFKGESIEDYKKRDNEENISYKNPFGGGSGAGVSIKPVAFLIIQNNNVKLLPVEHTCAIDKILDYMPELCNKTEKIIEKMMCKEQKTQTINENPPKIKKTNIKYDYKYDEQNKKNNE